MSPPTQPPGGVEGSRLPLQEGSWHTPCLSIATLAPPSIGQACCTCWRPGGCCCWARAAAAGCWREPLTGCCSCLFHSCFCLVPPPGLSPLFPSSLPLVCACRAASAMPPGMAPMIGCGSMGATWWGGCRLHGGCHPGYCCCLPCHRYVVLFFYPLDWTFVCPTEIIAFSDRIQEIGRAHV